MMVRSMVIIMIHSFIIQEIILLTLNRHWINSLENVEKFHFNYSHRSLERLLYQINLRLLLKNLLRQKKSKLRKALVRKSTAFQVGLDGIKSLIQNNSMLCLESRNGQKILRIIKASQEIEHQLASLEINSLLLLLILMDFLEVVYIIG